MKTKGQLSLIFAIVLQIGFASCSSDDENVSVSEITLNKTALTLNVGDEETLVATVLPDNAQNKTVTWTSSKTDVATVDTNGKITAISQGESIITAKAGDKTATCTVAITDPDLIVLNINGEGVHTFVKGDQIAFYPFLSEYGLPPIDAKRYIATFDGSQWVHSLRWSEMEQYNPEQQNRNKYKFIGHYPVQDEEKGKVFMFEVKLNQNNQGEYEASDLIRIGKDYVISVHERTVVNLTCAHYLAFVEVGLSAGSGVSQNEVDAATVVMKKMVILEEVQLANAAIGVMLPNDTNTGDIIPRKSTVGNTFYAVSSPIVFYQSSLSYIEISLGGSILKYYINDKNLEVDYQRIIKLNIKRNQSNVLELEKISDDISKWRTKVQ